MELLRRVAGEDAAAPAALLHRYSRRLDGLIRSRLSKRLARQVDAEDVLQSTYRSFFQSASRGVYQAKRRGDLWRLLATIAVRKVFREARRNRTSVEADSQPLLDAIVVGTTPGPSEIAAARGEVDRLILSLDDIGKQVLMLRLNDETTREIACRIGCSDRTVRRKLAELRRLWASSESVVPNANPVELCYSDYLLNEYVGSGRTGRVYRATRKSDGSTVAVKFLRKRFQADSGIVGRFFREMDIVQRLTDPGVIAVHGRGRTRHGGCFLVMDYASQGDLGRFSSLERPTPQRIVAMLRTVSLTLARLHDRGIVHCDLKPANIVVDVAGAPRLTDFGVAKRIGAPAVAIDGTAPFLAPEQVSARWGDIGEATDVYGLGATAFALLGGRPPWVGPTVDSILEQVDSDLPTPSLSDFAPSLPSRLIDVFDRCLQKGIRERFPTCTDLASALWDAEHWL
jgi:RNA polymerase sigma factor (sigma-70 family)